MIDVYNKRATQSCPGKSRHRPFPLTLMSPERECYLEWPTQTDLVCKLINASPQRFPRLWARFIASLLVIEWDVIIAKSLATLASLFFSSWRGPTSTKEGHSRSRPKGTVGNYVPSSKFNRLTHTVCLLLRRNWREVSEVLDLQSIPIAFPWTRLLERLLMLD
jgi:hypothetical protein